MKYIASVSAIVVLWLSSAIEQSVVGAWASIVSTLIAAMWLIGTLWASWMVREQEHRRQRKAMRKHKVVRLDSYIWSLEKEKVRLCGNTERTTLAG